MSLVERTLIINALTAKVSESFAGKGRALDDIFLLARLNHKAQRRLI